MSCSMLSLAGGGTSVLLATLVMLATSAGGGTSSMLSTPEGGGTSSRTVGTAPTVGRGGISMTGMKTIPK